MINFKNVRFKNFGSFGNAFTEIQLDRHSMTLISGCNGHGKSFALLDSITFGLFGRPFRRINIPQLVNSINKKNLIVEIEFEISNYFESQQVNFKNGYASLDDTPGFGIDIDKNIKEKFKFVKGTEFSLKR